MALRKLAKRLVVRSVRLLADCLVYDLLNLLALVLHELLLDSLDLDVKLLRYGVDLRKHLVVVLEPQVIRLLIVLVQGDAPLLEGLADLVQVCP